MSLLNFENTSENNLAELFSLAASLKKNPRKPRDKGETLGLLFLEPSTRTRLSFEIAGNRAGLSPVLFDLGHPSSLEKGETLEDTVLNFAAMNPAMLVVRCGDSLDLSKLSKQVPCPLVSGGWGVQGHPTQALLDLLTLKAKFADLRGKKILIVGDIKHSRVAASHFELAKILGFQIGQCGPASFVRKEANSPVFENLKDGLAWADAAMALRFQFERHEDGVELSKSDFRAKYGLNDRSLKDFKSSGWVLHPGPIHYGIEMEPEVAKDPRFLVFEQVQMGVFMREAIVRWILGERA